MSKPTPATAAAEAIHVWSKKDALAFIISDPEIRFYRAYGVVWMGLGSRIIAAPGVNIPDLRTFPILKAHEIEAHVLQDVAHSLTDLIQVAKLERDITSAYSSTEQELREAKALLKDAQSWIHPESSLGPQRKLFVAITNFLSKNSSLPRE